MQIPDHFQNQRGDTGDLRFPVVTIEFSQSLRSGIPEADHGEAFCHVPMHYGGKGQTKAQHCSGRASDRVGQKDEAELASSGQGMHSGLCEPSPLGEGPR